MAGPDQDGDGVQEVLEARGGHLLSFSYVEKGRGREGGRGGDRGGLWPCSRSERSKVPGRGVQVIYKQHKAEKEQILGEEECELGYDKKSKIYNLIQEGLVTDETTFLAFPVTP